MADVAQSFSTPIAAPAALCYEAIADFPAYPSWSSPVTEVNVLARHDDGMPHQVEFFVDMKLKTVRYVLAYAWHPPHRVTWSYVEGDLESIEGSYVFEPVGQRLTHATCTQVVVLGFWVPGLLRRPLEQNALRQSVLEFKTEAERRAAARERTPRRRSS